ncbi:hypothetical protein APSETT445_004215 [Aspergillus pseudonomiae]
MPPSSGHLLLPKFWRAARFAYEKACKAIRTKFPEQVQHGGLRFQPAYARITPNQPINRAAAIRQARRRHYSTRARTFVSYLRTGLQGDRAAYKTSRVASNISRLTSQAPFASTLRPNLTGGTLGRTAGGYTAGAGRIGGARVPGSPETLDYLFSRGVSEPQAPEAVDWQAMMSSENNTEASPELLGNYGPKLSFEDVTMFGENPWQQSSSSGYSSINISELGDRAYFHEITSTGFPESASEYEGSDGLHRFLAECNRAPPIS